MAKSGFNCLNCSHPLPEQEPACTRCGRKCRESDLAVHLPRIIHKVVANTFAPLFEKIERIQARARRYYS